MQRLRNSALRDIRKSARVELWRRGGGGHRVRVFALAKLNETNSELQRLKG